MPTCVQTLNNALNELIKDDERVYLLGEDIRDPYGGAFKVTKGLSTKYPDRLINTPISEAGLTGVTAGMALRGLRPVLEIMFGDFLSLCADQIMSNISKFPWMFNAQVKMPLVIRTPMGGRRGYGPTHSQSVEKIFFGVPGIKIVAPSIFHDAGGLLKTAVGDDEPVIFIENKLDYGRTMKTVVSGRSGEWFVKSLGGQYPTLALSLADFEDAQATIITYGGMTHFVEEAAKQLLTQEEVVAEVLIFSQIKPFAIEQILPFIQKTGRVVIVEEATLTAGWGAEMAALISEAAFGFLRAPVKRVAALDLPIANTKSLEDEILPDTQDIIRAVREGL